MIIIKYIVISYHVTHYVTLVICFFIVQEKKINRKSKYLGFKNIVFIILTLLSLLSKLWLLPVLK